MLFSIEATPENRELLYAWISYGCGTSTNPYWVIKKATPNHNRAYDPRDVDAKGSSKPQGIVLTTGELANWLSLPFEARAYYLDDLKRALRALKKLNKQQEQDKDSNEHTIPSSN